MSSLLHRSTLVAGVLASALIALGCSIKINSRAGDPPETSGDEATEDKPKSKPEKPKADKPKPEKPKPEKEPEKPKPEADKPKPPKEEPKPKPPKEEPKPKPPKEEPKPEEKPEPKPESQPERSKLLFPIRIPLETVERDLEAALPKTDKKDWTQVTDGNDSPKAEIKYELWRDPIKVALDDHNFIVTVPVRYAATIRTQVKNPLNGDWIWIAKNETWGTKADPQRIAARFEARVRVEEDLRVKAGLKLLDLKHGEPPSGKICKNAGVEICVTKESIAPKVRDGIDKRVEPKLRKALEKIEGQIARYLQVDKRAKRAWDSLQKPQLLPGTKDAWLVVQPTELGVSRPNLEGNDVIVDIALAGKVSVETGAKPAVKPVPLPKLVHVEGEPGLHVVAKLRIPAEVLTKQLQRELEGAGVKGKKVELPIKRAHLSSGSSRGEMHLKVELGDRPEDVIELRGKLKLDPKSQVLTLEDLELKVDPKSTLADKAAGLDQSSVRKQLASKLRWNLADETTPLKKAIVAALSDKLKGQATIHAELKQLDVRKLELTGEALEADVIVGGRLELVVTK